MSPVEHEHYCMHVKLHLHRNELTERMCNELQKCVVASQSECSKNEYQRLQPWAYLICHYTSGDDQQSAVI